MVILKMKLEIGNKLTPTILFSIRRAVTSEERRGFFTIGRLYKGYIGVYFSIRKLVVTLWLRVPLNFKFNKIFAVA